MATIYDISTVSIDEVGTVDTVQSGVLNITMTPSTEIDVVAVPTQADISAVEVVTPGPQGPAGLQNVYVQPTPPASPQVNWIWINIS